MNELDYYNRGEQIDSLLNQLEDMEQELTDKNMELELLQNQLREKDRQIQNLSSGNQKLRSQIQSVNSVLFEQGELLRQQTEKLEKYSGSDIIFQENERLKVKIAETKKKEDGADRKLARAKQLMTEYQTALAKEVAQVRNEIQRELRKESDKILRRQSRQLSGMTVVLLIAYLVQMIELLIIEKDTVDTIPLWFQDRYRNIRWLSKCIGDFYQRLYLKMTTEISTHAAFGILVFVSVIIAAICFLLIRMGLCYLLQKWKKRWKFYESRDMELLKKCAMAGIAFMGLSISMIVVNFPFIPFKFNVVSWWLLITGMMEYLYFYYDRNGF